MFYAIEETAKANGLAGQTVRNWISTGIIPTPMENRFGRGRFTGLTRFDVLMIIVAAELSHLGVGPKSFAPIVPQFAFRVKEIIGWTEELNKHGSNGVILKKSQKSGKYEPVPISEMIAENRFFVIFYSPKEKTGFTFTHGRPDEVQPGAVDTSKIVLDALELGNKAIKIIDSLQPIE